MQRNIQKIVKSLLFVSTFLIPFYFFRFSISTIPTNIFEVAVFTSLIFYFVLICLKYSSLTFESQSDSSGFFDCLSLKHQKSFTVYFMLAAFAVLAISTFISPDKSQALGIAKGWFVVSAVYAWLIFKNFDKKDFTKLSIPFFIAMILISIWALLQKIGVISTLFYQIGDASFREYLTEKRVFGPFESPNYLAMFLVPAFFLSLSLLDLTKKRLVKLTILISFVLPFLAIYFSGSRAGLIAFIICIFIYLNYRYINHKKATQKRPFRGGIFTVLFILIDATYLFYATRLANVSEGGDKIRVEIYKYALQMLKSNWLFGAGLGNFQNKISQISIHNDSFQQFALSYALHPHNLLLAVWLNLGLLGLVLFLYLIVVLFKNAFSSTNYLRAGLIAAMFAILIHGFFDTTYFKNDLSTIFWFIFAGVAILTKVSDEKTKEN